MTNMKKTFSSMCGVSSVCWSGFTHKAALMISLPPALLLETV